MKRVLMWLMFTLTVFSGTASAEVLIIGHKDVPETTLQRKALQEIFLGKRVQWKDTSTIHVATVKEPEVHKAFLKQYLNKSPAKWNAYWKRMVFTGNGIPPKQFDTQHELAEYVANTAGAIGYIDADIPVGEVNILVVQ